MTEATKIFTAERGERSGRIIVRGDGQPLMLMTDQQALWLMARIAEALAARTAKR